MAVSAAEVAGSGQRSLEHSSPILPGDAGVLLACSSREDQLRAEMVAIDRVSAAADADRQRLRLRTRDLQTRMIETYDAERCRRLGRELARSGVWLVPTLIWARRLAPLDAADGVDPLAAPLMPRSGRDRFAERRAAAIAQTAEETFALRRRIDETTRSLVGSMRELGVRLLAGSDAMDGDVLPGLALHQELELLVGAGASPLEALQAATREPARYLGEEGTRGTIEVGKRADLLLLDADPLANIANTRRIHALIVGGVLLSAADREKLMAEVVRFASSH
jgi:hypothetical protein